MTGIENGFHRSIPLLVLITLLFSACGGLPPTLTESPQLTITPPPTIMPHAFAAHIDDLSRPGTEYALSVWKFECRSTKRSCSH